MGRLLIRQGLRFVLGLFGAALLAAALSALSVPAAHDGAEGYASAFLQRAIAIARFDFGSSDVSGWSAFSTVAAALPYTMDLVLLGAIVAFLIGVPLGLLLGTGPVRRAAAPLIQVVAAAPVFCAALALSWISVRLVGIHPTPPEAALFAGGAAQMMSTLFLPVLTVGATGAAAVQLSLHRAASRAQGQPWRMGLRMMGLPVLEIERVYVAPEVFASLLADLGDVTLALFSAAAVAEWVFGWPGAAVLLVKAMAFGDWNVVALVMLIFASIKFVADFIGALACDALVGGEFRP